MNILILTEDIQTDFGILSKGAVLKKSIEFFSGKMQSIVVYESVSDGEKFMIPLVANAPYFDPTPGLQVFQSVIDEKKYLK